MEFAKVDPHSGFREIHAEPLTLENVRQQESKAVPASKLSQARDTPEVCVYVCVSSEGDLM